MRASSARSTGGRPGEVRFFDPSNFLATSRRCHARIVSGRTMVATSASALRPSCLPMCARVRRSPSVSFNRPGICARRMRFSATRYSLRRRSSASTEPVTYASMVFQSIAASEYCAWSENARHYPRPRLADPGSAGDPEPALRAHIRII